MSAILIRPERSDDIERITFVTEAAFRGALHGGGTEQFIVIALRQAGALTVSLVAERDGAVLGHVAFSPVEISDGTANWYGLGPVSVLPEFQRQGIGRALISTGLATLRQRGAAGCVVLGDPAYYNRFGFQSALDCVYEVAPPEYFLSLPFGDRSASGIVKFHAAFEAAG